MIIHKLEKYVFTEAQLKGAWARHNKGKSYRELTNEQLMALAKKIFKNASHSELEEFSLDSSWRTKHDITGKMIADDDSEADMHTELIDTEEPKVQANDIFIDRMLQLECDTCGFQFYIGDLSADITKLTCPVDGNKVKQIQKLKSLNQITEK
nr:hypothetical protein [Scopulibacillus darangshiensis]